MLDGVDAAVCESDDFVEDCECCLEGGEFDECFDGFCVCFAGFEDLLASPSETR